MYTRIYANANPPALIPSGTGLLGFGRDLGYIRPSPPPPSRLWPSYPPAIARCTLALITAIVSASCSFGLNWMNSVPVSAAGTCPGVM